MASDVYLFIILAFSTGAFGSFLSMCVPIVASMLIGIVSVSKAAILNILQSEQGIV